jgi:hypothetical protein
MKQKNQEIEFFPRILLTKIAPAGIMEQSWTNG